ncbi:MAG: cytochrome P450 [Myxococcales bacterium]|nr:cytochrome P450 [Myxococcota bacterium]MDW8282810.1 cytochrome P450 [Myxococcales bacterium]
MSAPRVPGPAAWQALPLALRLLRDPREVIVECTRRYGLVWRSLAPGRRGLVPLYWLMGPAGNERILAPPYRDDFSWYEGYAFTMEPLFGRDILFLLDDLDGDAAHRRRHRLLLPAFHPSMDAVYLDAMQDIILRRMAAWPDEGEVNLGIEVKQMTFHMVARILFGAQQEHLPALYRDFEELGLGLYSILRLPLPGSRFQRGLRARARLLSYIQGRIAGGAAGAGSGTLLGQLLARQGGEGEALSADTLVGEVLAFLFAGYDTTASLLTSFLVCLCSRPEVLGEVQREAIALSKLDAANLAGQQWLNAALLEAERLMPPLVFALRGVRRGFRFGGYDIEAGSKVAYSSYYTGRMAELFPEPERFLPERFLGGRRPPPYSVLGFGGGHRSCIGKRFAQLEMRLLTTLLLRTFDLWPVPDQPEEVFFNPTLQRRGGYRVRVRRRR